MAAAGSGGASWRTLRTWDRAAAPGGLSRESYLTRPAAPATPPPARCGPADLQNLDLSFIRTYRPMLDDGPGRALHTMADYRKWGDENLHPVAGFSPEAGRPGSVRPGGEAPRLDELSHANEQPPGLGGDEDAGGVVIAISVPTAPAYWRAPAAVPVQRPLNPPRVRLRRLAPVGLGLSWAT